MSVLLGIKNVKSKGDTRESPMDLHGLAVREKVFDDLSLERHKEECYGVFK